MLVDFHMHSIYSDGVKSPEGLLRHAIDCNLSMMALTDHDEIDGIKALRTAQEQLDPEKTIKIINGCEFSADYKDKSIHILGYRFDETNKELRDFSILNQNEKNESMKLLNVVIMLDIAYQKMNYSKNFLKHKLMGVHILDNY